MKNVILILAIIVYCHQSSQAQNKSIRIRFVNGRELALPSNQPCRITGDSLLIGDKLKYRFTNDSSLNTLYVPEGLEYSITFSDGTKIVLNSKSSVKFPFSFSGEKSMIRLRGEAIINIPPSKRVFEIKVFNALLQTNSGNLFVKSYGNIAAVRVFEGSLVIKQDSFEGKLKNNQAAIIGGGGVIMGDNVKKKPSLFERKYLTKSI